MDNGRSFIPAKSEVKTIVLLLKPPNKIGSLQKLTSIYATLVSLKNAVEQNKDYKSGIKWLRINETALGLMLT